MHMISLDGGVHWLENMVGGGAGIIRGATGPYKSLAWAY